MTQKIVIKIGGSNLTDINSLSKIIKIIDQYEKPVIIVVSAFYGITDSLIGILDDVLNKQENVKSQIAKIRAYKFQILEHYISDKNSLKKAKTDIETLIDELEKYLYGVAYIGETPDFLSDKILSYGERLSSSMINAIFNNNGIVCNEVLPAQIGLRTNDRYGDASIDFGNCITDLEKVFSQDQVYVVPGFYGISSQGKVNLLGRGGTDYSAASIARLVNARSLDIWKDVNGFMSADPKVVQNPVRIDHLSYSEAAELAYFGANILHPRTIEPLINTNIPIRLFDIGALNGSLEPLTHINASDSEVIGAVKSITSSREFSVLKLKGPGLGYKPGILATITTSLNEADINIKSVITSQIAINFLLSAKDLKKSAKIISALALDEVNEVIPVKDIAVVAVVGQGILEQPGIGYKIFKSLADENINVLMSTLGGSDVVCYLVIDKNHEKTAITKIHDTFFTKTN
ncbi:MAG: aspartate kinase [Bacteroidetes bacterium HGW-Bacteroidetes-17]|nr:MAG: aspartate kinase [Bacteroidetes bacterium HGW-Bacteroidetes-17]